MKITLALAAAALCVHKCCFWLNTGGTVGLGLCEEMQQVGMPGALHRKMHSVDLRFVR
jgi:hypothetical protein